MSEFPSLELVYAIWTLAEVAAVAGDALAATVIRVGTTSVRAAEATTRARGEFDMS